MNASDKNVTSTARHAARTVVRGLLFAFGLSGLGFAVLAVVDGVPAFAGAPLVLIAGCSNAIES
jgi:hypothetical protein